MDRRCCENVVFLEVVMSIEEGSFQSQVPGPQVQGFALPEARSRSEAMDSGKKTVQDEEANKIEKFCQKMGIQDGSILSRQKTHRLVEWGQRILAFLFGNDTSYSSHTHIATVAKVDKNFIQILETRTKEGGLSVKTLTYEQFRGYINKKGGLAILNHETHTKEVAAHVAIFAKNYSNEAERLPYQTKRFITAPFLSSAENDKSRQRTLHTFKSGKLLNSSKNERSGAICSEIGVELLKLAQISTAAKADGISPKDVTTQDIERWQKEGKVVNLNSHRTTPATFVRTATQEKMGFKCKMITKDDVQMFERAEQQEQLDLLREKNWTEISKKMKAESQK